VLRTRDFAGRKGGEEFAVLLPDTEIAVALDVAERIRVAISEISLAGTDVSVTASFGVAGDPDHASTVDRLERLADAALYVAKRQGRNRVELAEPAEADALAPALPPAPSANGSSGSGLIPEPATEVANGSWPVTEPAAPGR
jgi:predicted signal transduction protein with EAL and GGDEF domain